MTLVRVNKNLEYYFKTDEETNKTIYEYSILNLQLYDTIELQCSECDSEYHPLNYSPTKAFFCGFKMAVYRTGLPAGKNLIGFRDVFIFTGDGKLKSKLMIKCGCDNNASLKYYKINTTRMVLIEKRVFE